MLMPMPLAGEIPPPGSATAPIALPRMTAWPSPSEMIPTALPAMRLPAPVPGDDVAPPTVLAEPPLSSIPSLLGSATSPVASVPMKFPSTTILVEPASRKTPSPAALPEIRLRALAVVPPMVLAEAPSVTWTPFRFASATPCPPSAWICWICRGREGGVEDGGLVDRPDELLIGVRAAPADGQRVRPRGDGREGRPLDGQDAVDVELHPVDGRVAGPGRRDVVPLAVVEAGGGVVRQEEVGLAIDAMAAVELGQAVAQEESDAGVDGGSAAVVHDLRVPGLGRLDPDVEGDARRVLVDHGGLEVGTAVELERPALLARPVGDVADGRGVVRAGGVGSRRLRRDTRRRCWRSPQGPGRRSRCRSCPPRRGSPWRSRRR